MSNYKATGYPQNKNQKEVKRTSKHDFFMSRFFYKDILALERSFFYFFRVYALGVGHTPRSVYACTVCVCVYGVAHIYKYNCNF